MCLSSFINAFVQPLYGELGIVSALNQYSIRNAISCWELGNILLIQHWSEELLEYFSSAKNWPLYDLFMVQNNKKNKNGNTWHTSYDTHHMTHTWCYIMWSSINHYTDLFLFLSRICLPQIIQTCQDHHHAWCHWPTLHAKQYKNYSVWIIMSL